MWRAAKVLASGFLLLAFCYGYESREICKTCWSSKIVEDWGIGDPQGVALRFPEETITRSHLHRDFCGPDHRHDWDAAGAHLSSFAWGGYVACGFPKRNRFCVEYENDPQFRAFIGKKISQGVLMRAQALELMTVTRPPRAPSFCPNNPPAVPPKAKPENPENRRLRRLGHELFAEFFRGGPDQDYWFWW